MSGLISLDAAINNFLNDLEYSNRSPRTIDFYNDHLRHLSDHFPGIDLEALTAEHIRAFFASRDLSKTYALHAAYRSFRAFCNWCVRQAYIDKSPMAGFTPPTLPERIRSTLTVQEIRKLLSTQPRYTFLGRRNRMTIMVLWDTGMRASEFLGLKLDDLDLRNRAVRIVKGKGNKERIVHISDKTTAAVRTYLGLDTHPADKAVHRGGSDYLVLSEERRPLGYEGLREALLVMAQTAGITKQVSPHVFRHTWARMTLAAGVDSRYVQTLGGWANLDMVGQYTKDQQAEDALRAQRSHLLADRLL